MNYNQKVGKFGEDLAIQYLKKNGYKIIDQNIKLSYKELDIVADVKGKTIFVEVKTRTSLSFGKAEEGMSARKLHRLKKALSMYLNGHKNLNPDNIRLDLISVDIDKVKKTAKIKHYKDLF